MDLELDTQLLLRMTFKLPDSELETDASYVDLELDTQLLFRTFFTLSDLQAGDGCILRGLGARHGAATGHDRHVKNES